MNRLAVLLFAAVSARAGTLEGDVQSLGRLFDGLRPMPAAVQAAPRRALPPPVSAQQRTELDVLFAGVSGAAAAWPGYDFLGKPFLAVFEDGSAVLIGHPAPPPSFQPRNYNGRTVYVADRGPDIGFNFKLNYDFGGAKITAVRQTKEDGGIADLFRLAIHERFHDHQRSGRFTAGYRQYRVEEAQDVALAALEERTLASWLETGDAEAMRDFAALRLRRRALFPGTAAETGEENLEGTARFVDQAALSNMAGDAESRRTILEALRRPLVIGDMAKHRAYAVGATLGRFLETRSPGKWQAEVASGRRLSELALERLALGADEARARADRLISGSDFPRLVAEAAKGIQELRDRRDAAMRRFESQPGTRIRLSIPDADIYFSSQWWDYPDGSMLFYSMDEWVADGEGVRVRLTDVLMREKDDDRELVLPPGASLEVDGAPWAPAPGRRDFARLVATAPGISIALESGFLEYDGVHLTLKRAGRGQNAGATCAECR